MSKENRQVPGFESLYDVGDENFSLSKSLEVDPIAVVASSSSFFFSGGLHAQKKNRPDRRLYCDNNCFILRHKSAA